MRQRKPGTFLAPLPKASTQLQRLVPCLLCLHLKCEAASCSQCQFVQASSLCPSAPVPNTHSCSQCQLVQASSLRPSTMTCAPAANAHSLAHSITL